MKKYLIYLIFTFSSMVFAKNNFHTSLMNEVNKIDRQQQKINIREAYHRLFLAKILMINGNIKDARKLLLTLKNRGSGIGLISKRFLAIAYFIEENYKESCDYFTMIN